MTSRFTLVHWLLTFLVMSLSTIIQAQPQSFFGAGAGQVDHNLDNFSEPTGIELYFGHKFSPYLAVDAIYVNFGRANRDLEMDSGDSFGANLRAIYPLHEKIDLFARVGVHRWKLKWEIDGLGKVDDDSGADLYFGIGGDIEISDQWRAGLRYTLFETKAEPDPLQTNIDEDDQGLDMWAFNLELRF